MKILAVQVPFILQRAVDKINADAVAAAMAQVSHTPTHLNLSSLLTTNRNKAGPALQNPARISTTHPRPIPNPNHSPRHFLHPTAQGSGSAAAAAAGTMAATAAAPLALFLIYGVR